MDDKSAYQQAKRSTQRKHEEAPKEENRNSGLWDLLVPTYGPTDSGGIWCLTSFETLPIRFSLQ